MPRVTINIPTYQRDESLRRAIESALSQTFTDLEVNVSDNAASPTTRELVESFGDPRLSYSPLERNVGLYGNLTRCLHLGSAPFVLMLHDDDLLYPECIEVLFTALQRAPAAGIAHSALDYTAADGEVLLENVNWADASADRYERGAEFVARTLLGATRIAFSAALLRREAIAEQRVDSRDLAFADMGLWLRIARSWDVVYIHRPLAGVAIHTSSASAELGFQQVDAGGRARIPVGVSPHRPHDPDDQRAQVQLLRNVKLRFVRDHISGRRAKRDAMKQVHTSARRELTTIVADVLDDQSPLETIRDLKDSARIEPTILLTTWPFLLAAAGVVGRGPYDRRVAERTRG